MNVATTPNQCSFFLEHRRPSQKIISGHNTDIWWSSAPMDTSTPQSFLCKVQGTSWKRGQK